MVDMLVEWNRDRTMSAKTIDLQTTAWIRECSIFVSPCDALSCRRKHSSARYPFVGTAFIIPFMAISSDQFPARHPYLLWVGAVCGALHQATQSVFVIEDQQAGHKEAVEPGVNRPGALAQGETQASTCAAQQGYAKERAYARGEIWGLRPYRHGLKLLGYHAHQPPWACMCCGIEQRLITQMEFSDEVSFVNTRPVGQIHGTAVITGEMHLDQAMRRVGNKLCMPDRES